MRLALGFAKLVPVDVTNASDGSGCGGPSCGDRTWGWLRVRG